ncbi:serine hydrolase [bacterium]|nr:serine hydrolase [bacterium]
MIWKTFLFSCLLISAVGADPGPAFLKNLPQLDSVVDSLLKESGAPGAALAVIYKGEVVYIQGYGVRQLGKPERVDADTVFQMASCSKPITSTMVAALVSQHRLDWDDPIQRYVPEFRFYQDWVTPRASLRDMLSHRSGLPGFAGDMLEELGLDRPAILHQLRFLPPAYPFRSGYAYSNYGYTLGGEAAARAYGAPFEEVMEKELFVPLGMTSASARYRDFLSKTNRATTHFIRDGKVQPTLRNAQAQAPAGGVSCSIRDFARWAQFHLAKGKLGGRQLIAPEVLEETYNIQAVTRNNPGDFSDKGYYALGWAIRYDQHGRYVVSHSGAFSKGVRTVVTLVPQEDLGVVAATNAFPSGIPEAVAAGVVDLYDTGQLNTQLVRDTQHKVNQAMSSFLVEQPKPAAGSEPALANALYTGQFENDFLGRVRVLERNGALVLQLSQREFLLRHLNRDTFWAHPVDEAVEVDDFEVSFLTDAQGKVQGFRQHGLSPVGSDWFGRI